MARGKRRRIVTSIAFFFLSLFLSSDNATHLIARTGTHTHQEGSIEQQLHPSSFVCDTHTAIIPTTKSSSHHLDPFFISVGQRGVCDVHDKERRLAVDREQPSTETFVHLFDERVKGDIQQIWTLTPSQGHPRPLALNRTCRQLTLEVNLRTDLSTSRPHWLIYMLRRTP